jgi:hypothetical protein
MATNESGTIQTRKDFKDTPSDQYKYWNIEMQSAGKRITKWQTQGDLIQRRYLDDRAGGGLGAIPGAQASAESGGAAAARFRLNLFHSNTKTIINMLYGKLPRIDVSRTDHTGNDDVARVAAEMMERLLRLDLADHGDEHAQIFKSVLQDRMLPGLGCARVRYEMVESDGAMVEEAAPFDYYYWGDMMWGWARTYADLPWIAFRNYLNQDEAEKRFGKEIADGLTYEAREVAAEKDGVNDPDQNSAWKQAQIWEIWDKKKRKVIFYSKGYDKILETKADPLKLRGFFPNPPFFIANPTNALYKPTPDYQLAQDLYNEIDMLQTRIAIITEAVKVVGVYDASATALKRMFKEGNENDMIPVDNWALFAEKGGIQGQVVWMPIVDIVEALDKLRSLRDETIGLLQQVTGMADIMRGELANQYEGVGQTQVKAKFASTRVQALSEEFARFVTDLQQLKAEVIAKHFSPETIVRMSNMVESPDAELIPQAVELIKNPEARAIRIEIKPETMAMEDYAQLQAERSNYLNGLSTFLQAATPLIQQDPRSVPFLLKMLQWAMAGFKGASDIEGVLDQAIEVMSQPEQQQEPPPSEADKAAQANTQLEQMRAQNKQAEAAQKLQNDLQIREQDMQMDVRTREREHQMEMEKNQQETYNELQVIAAKMEADVQTELLTSQINAEQQQVGQEGEIKKAVALAKIDVMKMVAGKREDRQTKIIEKSMDSREHDKDLAQPVPKPNGGGK